MVAFIGQDDAVLRAFSLIEIKSAEIDPRAATHALIDSVVCCHTTVVDGVAGVRDAVFGCDV